MEKASQEAPRYFIHVPQQVMLLTYVPLTVETITTGPGSIRRQTCDSASECFATGIISKDTSDEVTAAVA